LIGLAGSIMSLALITALVPSTLSLWLPAGAQPPAAPTDALASLNEASRAAYRHAKDQALANAGPVILFDGDNMILRRDGERTEVHLTPPIYQALKAVAHIPLAVDVMTSAFAGIEKVADPELSELREYRKLVEIAAAGLASHGFDGEQLERQRKIISACLRFIDSVLECRRCGRDERIAFTRGITPLLMFNMADSARVELDAMHRQVSTWKAAMSAAEWDRVSVVIMGSAPPRKENLAVQYFSRLLKQSGEGPRITYAESVYDEPKALGLMVARQIDTTIGVDFFNDPTRMHRDLFNDAAKDYLPLLIDQP
jgi:hypothetical protein